ncbi:MAG: class I SAM-dependent methyltransferase [Pirellulales bacterium]
MNSPITAFDPPRICCNEAWEAAYVRFETPKEEIHKFTRRLCKLGALNWPRDARILELCCGRGNGLEAMSRLGFTQLEAVDLSPSLAGHYRGPARIYLCDCRNLPFHRGSKDIVIVQGGLHHVGCLPGGLEQTLAEASRVLVRGGLFVAVEPWMTPFLAFVHVLCRSQLARRLSYKIDCLAIMNEHEHSTYTSWLANPAVVLKALSERFDPVVERIAWGKLMFVGRKRMMP